MCDCILHCKPVMCIEISVSRRSGIALCFNCDLGYLRNKLLSNRYSPLDYVMSQDANKNQLY